MELNTELDACFERGQRACNGYVVEICNKTGDQTYLCEIYYSEYTRGVQY